jgi:hypothetical protein
MGNLCRNIEINNYSSIIERDQVLQIILKRNDSVILKKQNIQYMSSETLEESLYSKKKSSNEEKIIKSGKRINDNNLIKLKNVNNNFEYLGVFQGG